MNGGPVLVVHGGAGSLASEADRAAYREGVTAALEAFAPTSTVSVTAVGANRFEVAWSASDNSSTPGP